MYKAFLFIISFVFIALPVLSDHHYFYKEGTVLAHTENGDIRTDKLNDIPGYKGGNPQQTKYTETPERISSDATLSQAVSEEGKVLTEIQSKRKHFRIDPTTDPLFTKSNEILRNPEEAVKVTIEEESPLKPIKQTKICYEARLPAVQRCTMKRSARLRAIEEKKHTVSISSYRRGDQDPCGCGISMNLLNTTGSEHYHQVHIAIASSPFPKELASQARSARILSGPYTLVGPYTVRYHPADVWPLNHQHLSGAGAVEITYSPLPIEADVIETIEDKCIDLERAVEAGQCHYGSETIIEGSATKDLGGYSVKRDWWDKERTYICKYPSKNDCEPLRAQGCYQISSRCHVEREGRCLEDENKYECVTYPARNSKTTTTGEAPFCLTGDCSTSSWSPNHDMAEVMSKLSLLKEIKKEMYDVRTGRIFHGTPYSCSRHCINFSDCCGLSSGWGESLSLTRCHETEKLLAQKRSESKCHEVGTYCAEEKPIIGCIRKKTVFCCFGSKLARIIHEQGRAQLGIDWGTPKSPSCRPFTMEEISRIDFNRINFSEIFADVMQRVKVPDTSKILTQFQSDWKDRLPTSAELSKAELSDTQQMKNKVSHRRTEVKSHLPAGSYSLHGNPLPTTEREEEEARMVF